MLEGYFHLLAGVSLFSLRDDHFGQRVTCKRVTAADLLEAPTGLEPLVHLRTTTVKVNSTSSVLTVAPRCSLEPTHHHDSTSD